MRVAVVGASGFVGRALLQHLLDDPIFELTALSRNPFSLVHAAATDRFRWLGVDLHNMLELESALEGMDSAVYLVHSMLPTARLNQGNFSDFDLSLADNFARAARRVGVKHVVYLSGLIPNIPQLSDHLQSRLEVEEVLRCYVPRVTCLRTGIIVGAAGSSFTILQTLVRRLPVMICPKWTHNLCQVISLQDAVHALLLCLKNPNLQGETWDIGAEPPISYLAMMQETAKLLHLRRRFWTFPLMTMGLSKLWVRMISRAPKDLVYPLVESLKASMLVRPKARWPVLEPPLQDFRAAVLSVLPILRNGLPHRPHAFHLNVFSSKQSWVRSIQRLPLPAGRDAAWVAAEYLKLLPKLMPLLIRVEYDGPIVHLKLKLTGHDLLTLEYSPERSSADRQLFYVKGGILASRDNIRARFELRETLGGTACLAAVHDFRPALPWLLYRLSQAEVHRLFMYNLAVHLRKLGGVAKPPR